MSWSAKLYPVYDVRGHETDRKWGVDRNVHVYQEYFGYKMDCTVALERPPVTADRVDGMSLE